MRVFLIIVLLVMVAIFAGWLTFTTYGNQATITIDGEEFRSDTRETIDSAKELFNKKTDSTTVPEPVQPRPGRG